MHQTHPSTRRRLRTRVLSLVMALTLLLGLVPWIDLGGEGSAHWADSYLSQLAEWGLVRPDQITQPDQELTRADFMAITNRAYGYSDQAPTPFEDIKETDWFYDDVEIAYTNKYIKGTSETTASPDDTLTRETAATILGRNMMMPESAGEILDFTDAREISFWSKGVIKSSLEHYLVSGYDDGTFRPQKSVTWGEMAAMLTRIVGTPLQEPGDYSLGGVFGNVTISSHGVTLRDTVISGDLYVTGGVGLGDIKLENVTVLGRIICSGTGEAEGGQASIILRNVTADELLIDNLQGKTVSVQADGITEIGRTTVATSAYIEDNTPDGLGLHYISLEGHAIDEDDKDAKPPELTLAGRIENVVNKTPGSLVHVAKGTVGVLTIDEAATDSQVTIDRNSEVKELNLDTATYVDGEGDIKHLNVNAPDCEVTILPEEIYIRPGLTAVINGEEMDTTAAEESNMEPQILAGYPAVEDVAPTTVTAVFAANKKGKIYWAISPINDGSVGAEDLIKPPVYGAISIAHGSVSVPKADEEVRAAVKGLTPGGSFYLSAVLVDERGLQSPVKVISFSTPDNTVPAFCTGYPYMSKTSVKDGCLVAVMPTKSCNLYYALLPSGAKAPTEDEFRSGAVSGALGYGMRPVTKNTEDVFRVDDVALEEQKEYVLYLWLVDADGTNKGKITSIKFTTDDETLPYFIIPPTVNKVQATSVGLNFQLNEDGTVYWAVVPSGTEYPQKQPGTDELDLSSDWAKLQVQSGANSFKSGSVKATGGKDGTINVSGLEKETAYDFWYVAVDNAGNYTVMIYKLVINTLDENGPKIHQYFSKYDGTDNTVNPMPSTDIILEFSENVRYSGANGGEGFLELYQAYEKAEGAANQATALARLVTSVRGSITLWREDSSTGQNIECTPRHSLLPTEAGHDSENPRDWVIDYEKVTVEMRDGKMLVTFPEAGLQLDSGATYYFTIHDLTDTSGAHNPVAPSTVDFNEASEAMGHHVPKFTTVFADVFLSDPGLKNGEPYERRVAGSTSELPRTDTPAVDIIDTPATIDMHFQITPRSTKTVDENIKYDILLWSDTTCSYDLYYRIVDKDGDITKTENGSDFYTEAEATASRTARYGADVADSSRLKSRYGKADSNGWVYLGYSGDLNVAANVQWEGKTVNGHFNRLTGAQLPALRDLSEDLRYEFAISLRSVKGSDIRSTWSGQVKMRVQVAAGQNSRLSSLSSGLTWATWTDFLNRGLMDGAQSVGKDISNNFHFDIFQLFTDSRLPMFNNDMPSFVTTSDSVTMNLALNRAGTIYYAIGKADIGQGAPAITTTYIDITNPSDDPNSPHPVPLNPGDNDPWVPHNGTENSSYVAEQKSVNADPYRLVDPLNQYIFNPSNWTDRLVDVKTGSIENPGGALSTPNVSGLEPDTVYYAYFVLKGVAQDISRVYVYQFKTEPIRPPKILELQPVAGGQASTEVDVNSLMDYRVFNTIDVNKANIDILFQKLDGNNNPAYKVPAPYNRDDMTILDALVTPYDINNVAQEHRTEEYVPWKDGKPDTAMNKYTVFDIYANNQMKIDVYRMILDGRSSGIYTNNVEEIDNGKNIRVNANTPTTLPLKNILNGGTYTVITMAHNQQSSEDGQPYEIYSFRAAQRIGIVEQGAPKIDRFAGGTADPDRPSASSSAQTYSGSFSILFDKNVYWRENANSPYYPAAGKDDVDENGNLTQKDILTNVDLNNPAAEVEAVTTSVPTNLFRFNFKHMKPNDSIIIPRAHLCNSSGQPVDNDLIFTFKYETTTSGTSTTTRFYVVAEWGSSRAEIGLYETSSALDLQILRMDGAQLTSMGGNYAVTLNASSNSIRVRAVLNPSNDGLNFTWSLSNPDNAIIMDTTPGEEKTITGLAAGSAVITVSAGNMVRKTITVTVDATQSVSITPTNTTVNLTSYAAKAAAGNDQSATFTIKSSSFPNTKFTVRSDSNTNKIVNYTCKQNPDKSWTLTVTAKNNVSSGKGTLDIVAGNMKIKTITVSVQAQKSTGVLSNTPIVVNPKG